MIKKILYFLTGLMAVIMSVVAHASLEVGGPTNLYLQQGTDYTFTLSVDTNHTPVELRTSIIQPSEEGVEILTGTPLLKMYASPAVIPFRATVGQEARGS